MREESLRNEEIERATDRLIALLDRFIEGQPLSAPIPVRAQRVFDDQTRRSAGGSVRLASAFFVAYSVGNPDWDFASIPVGIRGQHGDKKLAAALTDRHVTFHLNITAFGENLGWKGNVRRFNLQTDDRFSNFLRDLSALDGSERAQLVEHVAWRLFESRAVPRALPTLPATYLTYSRALALCEDLIRIPSEGHIQQFLVAGFLTVQRARLGWKIVTHHPHASDKFDATVGDIEEYIEDRLIAAYEVTVRDDWKNRLPDFRKKLERGGLTKYVIIASNVRDDPQLRPARALVAFTDPLGFDLAVVDIQDFFSVFCAELSKDELVAAFNKTYEFISSPTLCGRHDIMDSYRDAVGVWMEAAAAAR